MVPLAGLQIVQFKIFMVMGFCHVIIYALYPFAGNLISLVHTLYCLNSGEFILFPPYVMHHSYGDSDVSFKRLVLYFTREMIAVPGVTDVLSQHAWVYKSDE